jgi:hypothetical protein
LQDDFEEEMQSFLGGEDCPVFNNMYQYCQVCCPHAAYVDIAVCSTTCRKEKRRKENKKPHL